MYDTHSAGFYENKSKSLCEIIFESLFLSFDGRHRDERRILFHSYTKRRENPITSFLTSFKNICSDSVLSWNSNGQYNSSLREFATDGSNDCIQEVQYTGFSGSILKAPAV